MTMLALLLAAAASSTAVTGAVSVSVLDRSGAMVTDLRAGEVTLKEEGQPRVVKRVERDTRPLAVAVLVDSSEVMAQGLLRELARPVADFLESLPAEADRTLMTIGTAPELVPFEHPSAVRAMLEAKLPFGKLSLYDGIAEAADRLSKKSAARRALVVVMTDRFLEEDQSKAIAAVARASPLVLAVQFYGAGAYAPCLDAIVKHTGGRYEQVGAVTGVGRTLRRLRPELDAPWLVVYETPSAVEVRSVEVKVARKGVKVRVRPAGLP